METFGEVLRRRVLGLAFLVVLVGLLVLSVLQYLKFFTTIVPVTLQTSSIGSQLQQGSDVKVRGLIVGEVRGVHSSGSGATIDLALQPDKVGQIPANVGANLVPKTLFGEKYVDLTIPTQPSAQAIAAHDVIRQGKNSVELDQILNNLEPVLKTLQPDKLNQTLTAIATALQGRGQEIGDNLVALGDYLTKINPQLPTLQKDLTELAGVTTTYADAAPNLLKILANTTVTSSTITDQQRQLAALLTSTTTFATTADTVLTQNDTRIVQLAAVQKPTLDVVARYSPGAPCFLANFADFEPILEKAFAGGQFHIELQVVKNGPGYTANDRPIYGDNRGPRCYNRYPAQVASDGTTTFPNGHFVGPCPYVQDGLDPAEYAPYTCGGTTSQGRALASALQSTDSGQAGTAAEQQSLSMLLGPILGRPTGSVPAVADLLMGPVMRGTAVSVS